MSTVLEEAPDGNGAAGVQVSPVFKLASALSSDIARALANSHHVPLHGPGKVEQLIMKEPGPLHLGGGLRGLSGGSAVIRGLTDMKFKGRGLQTLDNDTPYAK